MIHLHLSKPESELERLRRLDGFNKREAIEQLKTLDASREFREYLDKTVDDMVAGRFSAYDCLSSPLGQSLAEPSNAGFGLVVEDGGLR